MATCFGSPTASSVPLSSSSPSQLKRHSFITLCAANSGSSDNSYPPLLKKLATAGSKNPRRIPNRPENPDVLPLLDICDSPKLMATPAELGRSLAYSSKRTRSPPPDVPSTMLHHRIVYIGMPLVPAVTELLFAELLYLSHLDSDLPVYLYINSAGTTLEDGRTVGLETDGFALYDCLMGLKTEIYTLAIGTVTGMACLLLAAGTKGKRFMLPSANVMIHEPRVPSFGMRETSDVIIKAKEAIVNRNTFIKLFAKHTGNSEEAVSNAIRRGPFHMDFSQAKEFGVIDKVYWHGNEELMKEYEGGDKSTKAM